MGSAPPAAFVTAAAAARRRRCLPPACRRLLPAAACRLLTLPRRPHTYILHPQPAARCGPGRRCRAAAGAADAAARGGGTRCRGTGGRGELRGCERPPGAGGRAACICRCCSGQVQSLRDGCGLTCVVVCLLSTTETGRHPCALRRRGRAPAAARRERAGPWGVHPPARRAAARCARWHGPCLGCLLQQRAAQWACPALQAGRLPSRASLPARLICPQASWRRRGCCWRWGLRWTRPARARRLRTWPCAWARTPSAAPLRWPRCSCCCSLEQTRTSGECEAECVAGC